VDDRAVGADSADRGEREVEEAGLLGAEGGALVLEREVTPEGRQVMASLRSPVLVDAPTVVPVEVPVSKQAKAPTPVVQRKDKGVVRGEAPSQRNPVVQGLIERGTSGAGKHKNPQDYARGHARNPKHKGQKGWGAEYMALPVEEALGAEYMQDHSAKHEKGVSVDPTKDMSKADAAEWKKQNAIHRSEFTASAKGLLPSEVADKVAKLMSRQEAILKKYVEEAGSRAVDQYDDLPKNVRDALTRVKDQETLWSDAERWLSDNRSRRASVNRADLLPSEAYRLRAARYDRGPLSPSEKNDLFEGNPEFADMNENPPESVLSVREQMGRQAARYSRDPYWMVAKSPGVDKNGKPFRAGERVFYYPNGKVILTGKEAEAAARNFDAARFDEDGY
jgi:hypothetical protein